ncbi:hypothetical protein HPB47_008262 [Ixodes persulcatus]|uniref:Uncharacterized protein n=1 Tax=Ixodes persulcatus TaxID=34615 RepID=A0AC60P598_IXOPE|nr:hypothetical protein HPB47_008262 [Ixodes persulcatus]
MQPAGSYFHRVSNHPLLPYTTGDVLERTFRAKGSNVAIVSCHQNITKTYAEFKRDVDQLAAGLVSLKLGIQSKIAIIASNTYEWVVTQFAAAKAGLVLVNINTAFQVTELEYCLILGECVAVIYAEKFVRQDYYKMLLEMAPEIKDVKPGELKSLRVMGRKLTDLQLRSHIETWQDHLECPLVTPTACTVAFGIEEWVGCRGSWQLQQTIEESPIALL